MSNLEKTPSPSRLLTEVRIPPVQIIGEKSDDLNGRDSEPKDFAKECAEKVESESIREGALGGEFFSEKSY